MTGTRGICSSSKSTIPSLPSWIENLGGKTSSLDLFEGTRGRGLRFQKPVSVGECVASVPLRACLVDLPKGEEKDGRWEDAREEPRLARLADMLAHELSLGNASDFQPYVEALPPRLELDLPAPSYTEEDAHHVQYEPCLKQLRMYRDRLASSQERRYGTGAHPDDERRFAWAMAAVHSRSFACGPARLLVPYVDFCNHAGDSTPWHLRDTRVAHLGNLQWRVAGPDEDHANVELLSLVTGQPEEALLSYGERSSDHFYAFYGFVPKANPHEDVILFEGLHDCVDWMRTRGWDTCVGGSQEWEERCKKAEHAVSLVEDLAIEAGERGAVEAVGWKLLADGRVDARLLSAVAALRGAMETSTEERSAQQEGSLSKEDLEASKEVVLTRCEELMKSFPTSLLDDLAALVDPDATLVMSEAIVEHQSYYRTLYEHYASRSGGKPIDAYDQHRLRLASPKERLACEYRVHKKIVLYEAMDAGLVGL